MKNIVPRKSKSCEVCSVRFQPSARCPEFGMCKACWEAKKRRFSTEIAALPEHECNVVIGLLMHALFAKTPTPRQVEPPVIDDQDVIDVEFRRIMEDGEVEL